MFILKFVFYFTISFIILSIPVGKGQKVFTFLDQYTSPYTAKVHKKVKDMVSGGKVEVSKAANKVFNNTSLDKIKTYQSSTKRKKIQLPQDSYTPEEKEALLNILRQD